MATRQEEVRIKLTADTQSLKKGGRDAEIAFNNIVQGERRVRTNLSDLTTSLLSANDAGGIFVAGLKHIGESLKIGLGAAVGIGAAYAAYSQFAASGAEQVKKFTDAQDEANKASEETSKTVSASGSGANLAAAQKEFEQQKKLNDQKLDLQHTQGDASIGSTFSSLHGFAQGLEKVHQYVSLLTQGKFAEDEITALQTEQEISAAKTVTLKKQYLSALGDEASVLRDTLTGDEGKAKIEQAEIDRQKELNDLKESAFHDDETALALINKKYDQQIAQLNLTRNLKQEGRKYAVEEASISARMEDGEKKSIELNNKKIEAMEMEMHLLTLMGQQDSEHAQDLAKDIQVAKTQNDFISKGYELQKAQNQDERDAATEVAKIKASTVRSDVKQLAEEQDHINLLLDKLADLDIAGVPLDNKDRKDLQNQLDNEKITHEANIKLAAEQEGLLQAQLGSVDKMSDIQLGFQTAAEKDLETQREKLRLLNEQLAVMAEAGHTADNNDQAAQLAAQADAQKWQLEKAQVLAFKNPAQILRGFRLQRRAERRFEQQEKRFDRNEGLLNVQRGLGGEVLSGIDPLTGERVSGSGLRPHNALTTGGLDQSKGTNANPAAFANFFHPKTETPAEQAGKQVTPIVSAILDQVKLLLSAATDGGLN